MALNRRHFLGIVFFCASIAHAVTFRGCWEALTGRRTPIEVLSLESLLKDEELTFFRKIGSDHIGKLVLADYYEGKGYQLIPRYLRNAADPTNYFLVQKGETTADRLNLFRKERYALLKEWASTIWGQAVERLGGDLFATKYDRIRYGEFGRPYMSEEFKRPWPATWAIPVALFSRETILANLKLVAEVGVPNLAISGASTDDLTELWGDRGKALRRNLVELYIPFYELDEVARILPAQPSMLERARRGLARLAGNQILKLIPFTFAPQRMTETPGFANFLKLVPHIQVYAYRRNVHFR